MTRTPIGKLIEVAMAEKNFTQKDLANKMGVKQQMISQWINGQSNPKISTLKKLAIALNVSDDYFADGNKFKTENFDKNLIKNLISRMDLLEEQIKKLNNENELLRKEIELIKLKKK